MSYKDPLKQKQAQAEHYQKYKDKYRHRARDRVRALKEWLNEMKSTLFCLHCGEADPICLDFHHRDSSTKDKSVSCLISSMSKQKLLDEIAKCDVLCSNCHRKEHRRLRDLAGEPEFESGPKVLETSVLTADTTPLNQDL